MAAEIKDRRANAAEEVTEGKDEVAEVKQKLQPPAFFKKIGNAIKNNKGKVAGFVIGAAAVIGTAVVTHLLKSGTSSDFDPDLENAEDADFTEISDDETYGEPDEETDSLS